MVYTHKHSKFIILLVFFLLYNTIFATAAFGESTSTVTVKGNILTNETITVIGNPLQFNSGSTYNASTSDEFISSLATALGKCETSVTINYTGSSVGATAAFLNTAIDKARQTPGNDYEKTLLYSWQYSYTSTSPSFTATFTFSYLEDAAKQKAVSDKVTEILSTIITSGMTEEQKEKAINDYIVLNVAYDTSLRDHTAYGALFGIKKTVCQGYALLAYKMLTAAGFEARIITGKANNIGHAWNMVKVGGVWYHLDCTWNDPVPDVPGRVSYKYFNLSDSQMRNNLHTWTANYYAAAPSSYSATDQSIKDEYANVYSSTPSAITIINNYKLADIIKVSGLRLNDKIKVYNQSSLGIILGSTTVTTDTTEASIKISQLGASSGKVYITVTSPNKMESSRVETPFGDEPATDAPTVSAITVSNNARAIDTVAITNLLPGDIVKIYDSSTDGKLLRTATVGKTATSAALSLALANETTGGSIYVTLTSLGKKESSRTQVNYNSAYSSTPPASSKVVIINNPGNDLIIVYGLTVGDTVKIYDSITDENLLKSATVAAKQSQVVISMKEGQLKNEGGDVYTTVTSKNKLESTRTKISYTAE